MVWGSLFQVILIRHLFRVYENARRTEKIDPPGDGPRRRYDGRPRDFLRNLDLHRLTGDKDWPEKRLVRRFCLTKPAALEIVQRAERPFDIGGPQNHQAGRRFCAAGEVGVLDVDARPGQPFGNQRERAGFIIAFDHQDVIFESEHAPFAEDHKRLGWVAHDHPDDGVIDRVGCGQCVDVDLGGRELGADAGEGAGSISEKNSELSGGLDLKLRIHEPENAPAIAP